MALTWWTLTKAVVAISLDWIRPIESELGLCSCGDRLRTVARGVLGQRMRAGGDTSIMGLEVLSDVEAEFGGEFVAHFAAWAESLWSELEGCEWDWFAYRFAMARWFGQFRYSSIDVFDFGPDAEIVCQLMERGYIEPSKALRSKVKVLAAMTVSAWDREVLAAGRMRIGEGDEELINLEGEIKSAVTRRFFQLFWKELQSLPHVISKVDPIADEVERSVKAETSFPKDRALPRPSAMRPSPSLFLAGPTC